MIQMTKQEAVKRIMNVRGANDYYTLLISQEAAKPRDTEREIARLMFDILLGVSSKKKCLTEPQNFDINIIENERSK